MICCKPHRKSSGIHQASILIRLFLMIKTIDAVVLNFEIIGEAANRIDQDFRDNNPEIEWNRIRGFRNRVVHEYFGIDYKIVWEIIETYLDEMIDWVETIIDNYKAT